MKGLKIYERRNKIGHSNCARCKYEAKNSKIQIVAWMLQKVLLKLNFLPKNTKNLALYVFFIFYHQREISSLGGASADFYAVTNHQNSTIVIRRLTWESIRLLYICTQDFFVSFRGGRGFSFSKILSILGSDQSKLIDCSIKSSNQCRFFVVAYFWIMRDKVRVLKF